MAGEVISKVIVSLRKPHLYCPGAHLPWQVVPGSVAGLILTASLLFKGVLMPAASNNFLFEDLNFTGLRQTHRFDDHDLQLIV